MTQKTENLKFQSSHHSQKNAGSKVELWNAANREPPRLGRRESEPHSAEISYLYDVLSTNFSQHRTIWDLHHYFSIDGEKINIQFDITFFLDLIIPEDLSSYTSSDYDQRIPDLSINVLSKSTWRKDLSEILELCRKIKIPIYIVFFSYPVAHKIFPTPFLRIYLLQDDGIYLTKELNSFMFQPGESEDFSARITLSEKFPFDIALKKISRTYIGRKTRSRLILLKKNKNEIFLTKAELEAKRADKEAKRADKESKRADKESKRADNAEKKIQELKKKIEKRN